MNILFLFIIIVVAVGISYFVIKCGEFFQKRIQFLHDPVYVPSSDEALARMITLASPKKGNVVADLGSGNGKLVMAFAELDCQVIGYEIDPFLVFESKQKIKKSKLERQAKIKWQSFWSADISQTDIVLLFMTASIMEKLEKKLQVELKPGAKVVSQRFIFPNWHPTKKLVDCFLYIQK